MRRRRKSFSSKEDPHLRKVFVLFAAVPFPVALMVGSGGGNRTSANKVPILLTIQGQPPAGLTIVFFSTQVTGATLQGGMGMQKCDRAPPQSRYGDHYDGRTSDVAGLALPTTYTPMAIHAPVMSAGVHRHFC